VATIAIVRSHIAVAGVVLRLLARFFRWRLAIAGSFGIRAVLFNDFERLFQLQFGKFNFSESVVHRWNFEVSLHLHYGRVGHVFSFLFNALFISHLGFLVCRYDDNSFALETIKEGHLTLLGSWVNVRLIQDVVASPLGSNLQQNVQAASTFFNQSFPSASVVFATRQAVHLHFIQESIRAQNIVLVFDVI